MKRSRDAVDLRERRILVWGSAAIFVAGWADVSVKNVSETLFLKRIGVELLPLAFLANAFVLMGTTSLLSALSARVDPLRLFTQALTGLAALLAVLWLAVGFGGDAAYPLLLMASKQIGTISLISFSGAMAALIDPRKAKRLLPPLLAGQTLGEILGSFASGPMGRLLDVDGLLPLAAVLLLLGAAATLPLRRLPAARLVLERRRKASGRAGGTAREEAPPISARALWRESWLFRALSLSALLCGAVGPMLYFQFSYVANQATLGAGGEEKLLALYGLVRGWLQIGVLAAQLWLAPILFRTLGVPLAGIFSPLLYLLGFSGLTIRLGLPEGVAALTGATVQDQAVHDPAQRLLAALFPEGLSARVTALVEGTAKRAGGCIGNVLVLAAMGLGSVGWVGAIGIPVAIAWFVLTVRIWKAYPSLMLSMVSAGRLLSRSGDSGPELLDAGTLRALARTLSDPDPARGRAAVELLRSLRPDATAPLLAEALPTANDTLRPFLIETLEALLDECPSEQGRERLAGLLRDAPPADPGQRASLVRAYATTLHAAAPDEGAEGLLAGLAGDSAPVVRLAAELARDRLQRTPASEDALEARLASALSADEADVRGLACRELRAVLRETTGDLASGATSDASRWQARFRLLVDALARPSVRREAAHAVADVAARAGTAAATAADAMLARADDPDPAVRAAVLRFIGSARLSGKAGLLAERLASPNDEEAAAAEAALRALGPAALDVLLQELSFGRRSVRDAIVPVLRDLAVEPGRFQSQLRRELDAVAERLLEIAALRSEDAPLLLQRLEERAQGGLHTAFVLLAALHDDDRIVDLGDALRRPQSAHTRALRVEALEGLLSPEERELLIPLVEDPRLEPRIEAAARLLGHGPLSREAALEAIRKEDDALTTLLLAGALGPGGRDGARGGPDPSLGEAELLLQLRRFRTFQHLTVRQLADVAKLARHEVVPAGVVIVREGDQENDLYAIVEGRVHVTKQDVFLSELRSGEIFGELSFFDGGPRSATVTTVEPTRVLRIEGRDLMALIEDLPAIAIAICRTLSVLVRSLSLRVGG